MIDSITLIKDLSMSTLIIHSCFLAFAIIITIFICYCRRIDYQRAIKWRSVNETTDSGSGTTDSDAWDFSQYQLKGLKYVLILSVLSILVDICLTCTQIGIITHYDLVGEIEKLYE